MQTSPDSCTQQGMGSRYTMPDIYMLLFLHRAQRRFCVLGLYFRVKTLWLWKEKETEEREDMNAGTLK